MSRITQNNSGNSTAAPPLYYSDPNYGPPPVPGGGGGNGAGHAPMMMMMMPSPYAPPSSQLPPPPPPLYPTTNGSSGFTPQAPFASGPLPVSQGKPVCTNCASSGHLRRNCPTITCMSCGRLGHFKQDCPTNNNTESDTGSGGSPDQGRRVRSREERDTNHEGINTHGVDMAESEGDYRWSVCRNCGSSRHIQAQCPARYQALECFQCHKRGHLMSSCPLTRCYNCGTYGHSSQVCHSMPHCFHCANVGHRSTECPVKTKGRVCYQCNEPGHEAARCPQGQLCRMCHQPGHLVAQCPQVTCNQCHEKGHTAGACERDQCAHCGGFHNPLMCAKTQGKDVADYYRSSSSAESSVTEDVPTARASLGSSPVSQEAAPWPTHSETRSDTSAQPSETSPTGIGSNTQDGRDAQTKEEASGDADVEGGNSSGDCDQRATPTSSNHTVAAACAGDGAVGSLNSTPAASSDLMRCYAPTGVSRSRRRVAVMIDGPYFERCIRRDGVEYGTEAFYRRVCAALLNTLDFIGDIFEKTPIGYWFDTDPAAFTDFVETAMPLAHRERAFRESALRKRFLTGEMNSGRSLPHVLPRLVGTMKKQRGYTQDGPGHVWVQSGVDVALATALVELFHDRRQFDQLVLLSGDSDIYPAVHYCNKQRMNNPAYRDCHPVRVCGTTSSLAKQYGQHQDLYDFLPPILLNQPSHRESDKTIDFAPYAAFR